MEYLEENLDDWLSEELEVLFQLLSVKLLTTTEVKINVRNLPRKGLPDLKMK